METKSWTALLMLLLTCFVQLGRCQSVDNLAEQFQEEAGQIYTTVFHKYKKNVRPPDFYPDPVPVKVHATLFHLRGLDILKQELETIIDLNIQWQDKRLAWYANKVVMITEELSEVWHPSVVYLNGALPPSPLFASKVTISKDGMITWTRREIVTTVCPTDPSNVTQACDIILGFTSPESVEMFDNSTTFTIIPDFSNHLWDVDTAEIDSDDSSQVRFALTLMEFSADPDEGGNVNSTEGSQQMAENRACGRYRLGSSSGLHWLALTLTVILAMLVPDFLRAVSV